MTDHVDSIVSLLAGQPWAIYEPDAVELQDPDSPPERPYVVVNGNNGHATAPRSSGRNTRQVHNIPIKIVGDSAASCRLVSRAVASRLEHVRPSGLNRPTPLACISGSDPMKDRGFKPALFVLTDVYRFATNAPLPEGVTP